MSAAPLALLLLLTACSGSGVVPGIDDDDADGDDTPTPPALRPCSPVLSWAPSQPTEGDLVGGEITCALRPDRGGLTFELLSTTADLVFDPGTARFTWDTDGSSSGPHELLVSVVGGLDGGVPETTVAALEVIEDGGAPPDPLTYDEEMGLPVFHIDPHSDLGTEYVEATVSFDGRSYPAAIKKRGASSLGYPKNSFTLRFQDEELDADRLEMGNLDRLVLLSTFDDASYVRQKLAYDQWSGMAEHQGEDRLRPRTSFVVLYLDGDYHGLYVSLDHVDDDFGQENGIAETANLYKAVSHDANFRRTDTGGNPKGWLGQGLDKKEGPEEDWSDLEALIAFVDDSDADTFHSGIDGWIDVEEFMDWFLFVHWNRAQDSAGKNAYLYNDPADPIFRFVPWDLNHSFGQGWYPYPVAPDEEDSFSGNNRIFERFHADPRFSGPLWDRHLLLRTGGPFSEEWLRPQVDGYTAQIGPAADRDWARWGGEYRSYFGMGTQDWTDDLAAVHAWISARAAWEDGH